MTPCGLKDRELITVAPRGQLPLKLHAHPAERTHGHAPYADPMRRHPYGVLAAYMDLVTRGCGVRLTPPT